MDSADAHPGPPTLVVLLPDGREHRLLLDGELTVGRRSGDVVIEDDPYLSGTHLRIRRARGRVILEDLNSTNGVFLRLHEEVELRPGDEILVGGQLFRFEVGADTAVGGSQGHEEGGA